MWYIYVNLMTHKRLAFSEGFSSRDKAIDFIGEFTGVGINATHIQEPVAAIGYIVRRFSGQPPERIETPC